MTITIKIEKAEELAFIEPLLAGLKASGASIQFSDLELTNVSESILPEIKPAVGIAQQLHGIIQLEKDGDFRDIIAEELLSKHSPI